MSEEYEYLPQAERKKILLLADDIRMHSGIATMAREFVIGTAHHYNWFQVGAAVKHPDSGKIFDLSEAVGKQINISDAYVRVLPNNGYGDPQMIRQIMLQEKPDAILIFTDPRYWVWLFEMEREIRSKIPIFYLSIWDSPPSPLYNYEYYASCDLHMCISKQTKNLTKIVLDSRQEFEIIDLDKK